MFITIEGIDGSGKSTQADHLANWLSAVADEKVIRTFEPGGWKGGKTLRKFILETKNLCTMSEFLLFMADRAEHLHRVIIPELLAGNHIICERWNESTLAYQCGGHGMDYDFAEKVIASCSFPEPDVKIFLDIPPAIAFSRMKSRENLDDKYKRDRFEAEGLVFLEKVSSFYHRLIAKNPDKFIMIDCGERQEYEIAGEIMRKLGVELSDEPNSD